ncbi:unnamed protein product [Vitrella brassicaformis CCMP3155]|uniref:Uncharacterized protein n=1 Tax=Vitrella brassicaformis (strain CCMP3155) TaxID=1169540 RepID=A0A0G4H2R4_VITBC|nr:unnamed protein product [Vitrella brassicaformis CCMP3155]|eukprot:CEM37954.1 unnamed protein product [Vitrella brassicaformis CCMP3155]
MPARGERRPLLGPSRTTHKALTTTLDITLRHRFLLKLFGVWAGQKIVVAVLAAFRSHARFFNTYLHTQGGGKFVLISLPYIALLILLFIYTTVPRRMPLVALAVVALSAAETLVVACALVLVPAASLLHQYLSTMVSLSLFIYQLQKALDFVSVFPYIVSGVTVVFSAPLSYPLLPVLAQPAGSYTMRPLGLLLISLYIVAVYAYVVYTAKLLVLRLHPFFELTTGDSFFAFLALYTDTSFSLVLLPIVPSS